MLARKSLSKKKTIILGGVLIVIWCIIGVVLYRTYFAGPSAPPPPPLIEPGPIAVGQNPLAAPVSESLGLEVLRESRLINLKLFGEAPLEIKALGREDPFATFNP